MRNLAPEAINQKSKTTFFSPTFKIGEKKVVLFFQITAFFARYSIFVIFSHSEKKYQISKKITFLTESFLRARTVFLLKVYAFPFRKKLS